MTIVRARRPYGGTAAALFALGAVAPRTAAASALRRGTGSAAPAPMPALSPAAAPAPAEAPKGPFGSLSECEAAYLHLAGKGLDAEPMYETSVGRVGGLVEDEDGGSIRTSQALRAHVPLAGRTLYKPPETRTGVASDITGWDYREHGDDWDRYGECGGPNQSPIDLAKYIDVQGQTKYLLWFDYYLDPELRPSKRAQLVNDGHALRYDVGPNGVDLGFVKVGQREYAATEYSFHAPSEHSLDGAVFPLELQVYNQARVGKGIVAFALFFREGPSNPFLAALKASMRGTAPRWTVAGGRGVGSINGTFPAAFNLEALIPKGDVAGEKTFYNYQGSLTQPPCTGGVDWWVLSVPITASRDEIRFIRRAIFTTPSMRHGNARAAMPLGNRSLFVGLTGFQHSVKGRGQPERSKSDESEKPRGYSSGDAPWGEHWSQPPASEGLSDGAVP
mmetsp:Transcript_58721/g.128979  ORF Transcript_58721/g.128979 Transcript_58721/m.128979 type:complete len:447 (-) Transcript_58721:6-1346(-)